ncbi:MAG: PepSY domain-containing protein [Massilibacteroides sp.]|nr:PepSY domain-containing protein [Massilibacteroides sp.]
MNKKILTLTLAGVLALGGTVVAYASTSKADTASNTTGKAVSEQQSKEADDQELNAANTKTAITEDQAKQTAMASVKNGTFQSIELEDEDGVIVYGVEIQSGNQTYDVKVDANTGSIVKTDQDNDAAEKGKIEKETQDGSDNDSIEHENDSEDVNGYED